MARRWQYSFSMAKAVSVKDDLYRGLRDITNVL